MAADGHIAVNDFLMFRLPDPEQGDQDLYTFSEFSFAAGNDFDFNSGHQDHDKQREDTSYPGYLRYRSNPMSSTPIP